MSSLEVLGPRLPTVRVAEPTADDIIAAVRSLDGHRELYLVVTEPVWLGVAGGPQRFFVGYTDDKDSVILQAVATATSGGPEEFVIGDQPTTVAAEYLVDVDVAITAAVHFLATGEPSPEVTWDRM